MEYMVHYATADFFKLSGYKNGLLLNQLLLSTGREVVRHFLT
jgi:hypothetical protein